MYASSDEELMPQVFAIDDNDYDLDLNALPTSGQEYLKRVMFEAKQYPKIVVAEISSDLKTNNHGSLNKAIHSTGKQPAPKGFAPTLKWQKEQESEFSSVRQQLLIQKARLKEIKLKRKLPLKEDVTGWCHLCFGDRPIAIINDSDTSDDNETSDRQPTNQGSPPLLSIILNMDQPTVIKVLEYHVSWFEATGFSLQQGCWFYSLLACLEKPLEPEVCSLLRTLARCCSITRATLEKVEDEKLAPLNLLICLIARYFGQNDLVDMST